MTLWQTSRHNRILFHEAGHAVHAVVEDLPFDSVWVGVPGEPGWTLGHIYRDNEQALYLDLLEDKMPVARQALAGFAAEEVWGSACPRWSRVRNSGDWCQAVWCARNLLTGSRDLLVPDDLREDPQIKWLLVVQWRWVQQMLRARWAAVERVASLLRRGDSVDYATVARVVEGEEEE